MQNVPQFEEVDFDDVICDPVAPLDYVDKMPEGKRMSLSGIITEVCNKILHYINNAIWNKNTAYKIYIIIKIIVNFTRSTFKICQTNEKLQCNCKVQTKNEF